MPADPAFHLDYAVDATADASHLVATMDAVSRWPEIVALRAWGREQLALRAGQRLLDVGCGPGDAAIALAADVGADGEVIGIDASDAMLLVARERAVAAPCGIRFGRGDAASLDLPDASIDAARSERTLQWVPEPAGAVAELHRVLRSGGRLLLIDTDWSTLVLETGDPVLATAVRAHLAHERRRPSNVGGRLWNLCHDAGFEDLRATAATHLWTEWDPDREPVPDGFFPIEGLVDDLVASGHLEREDAPRTVASIRDAARTGHLFMALTMFAVAGRRP